MKRIKVISEKREHPQHEIVHTCYEKGIVFDSEMSLEDTNNPIVLAVIERNERYLRSPVHHKDYRITHLSYKD